MPGSAHQTIRWSLSAGIGVVFLSLFGCSHPADLYEIVELPPVPGYTHSYAMAINDAEPPLVVGYCERVGSSSSVERVAVKWVLSEGVAIPVALLLDVAHPQYSNTVALGVNDGGVIVGGGATTPGHHQPIKAIPLRWGQNEFLGKKIFDLDPAGAGVEHGVAWEIDDNGTIVGEVYSAAGFVYGSPFPADLVFPKGPVYAVDGNAFAGVFRSATDPEDWHWAMLSFLAEIPLPLLSGAPKNGVRIHGIEGFAAGEPYHVPLPPIDTDATGASDIDLSDLMENETLADILPARQLIVGECPPGSEWDGVERRAVLWKVEWPSEGPTSAEEFQAWLGGVQKNVLALPGLPEGTSSAAYDVNHSFAVIGECLTPAGPRAVFWEQVQPTTPVAVDLNERLPSNSGWVLRQARGISEWGSICGNGVRDGSTRGFLMRPATPPPPPDDFSVTRGGPDQACVGGRLEYVYIVSNDSPESHAYRIIETVPTGTSFDQGLNPGWTPPPALEFLTAPLAPGATSPPIYLRLDVTAPAGGTISANAYQLKNEDTGEIRNFSGSIVSQVITISPTAEVVAAQSCPLGSPTSDVHIRVDGTPGCRPITAVQLFGNGAPIAEGPSVPFEFVWSDRGPGAYTIRSIVTDDLGSEGSAETSIEVTATGPPLPDSYRIEQLPLGPHDINESGFVVGTAYDASDASPFGHPATWNAGTLNVISTDEGEAISVNNATDVCGYIWESEPYRKRAVLWRNGEQIFLDPTGLGTGRASEALDINDAGQILLRLEEDAVPEYRIWQSGASAAVLAGIDKARCQSMNARGQIAGTFTGADTKSHAFRWTPNAAGGLFEDLGVAGEQSSGSAINDFGVIVGHRRDPGPPSGYPLWLWPTGSPGIEQGNLSPGFYMSPYDINSSAVVVGNHGFNYFEAFVAICGQPPRKLLSTLEAESGQGWYHLMYARAVNNDGIIVGEGLHETPGLGGGFILRPVD